MFVGYADTLRGASAQFPTPWEGSPGVTYEGCSPSASCSFDAGAVRVENGTDASQTITDVKVNVDTCAFDLWSFPVTLAPGHDLIVTQTADGASDACPGDGTMDTSDVGPGGVAWDDGNCNPDGILPTVDVTVAGVGTTTSTDSGQVLNTGGVDGFYCSTVSSNESQSWTPIGHPPPPCSPATLTLSPPNQSDAVGTTAAVTGNFSNSCGPLSNTAVSFSVISGPNEGQTGAGTTDTSGNARFSYTSASAGTDTLQASVTNPNGDITSNAVTTSWQASATTVLFIQGIGSSSTCPNSTDFKGRVSWLRNAISAVTPGDKFLYYAYRSPYTKDASCSGGNNPAYKNLDSCWSIDDTYRSGLRTKQVSGGGEASRLATWLTSYLKGHSTEHISIVAHSEGGVLAAYTVKAKLSTAYANRIRSIVTMDSPLRGINSVAPGALRSASACANDDLRLDSAFDMQPDAGVMRRIDDSHKPKTLLYTIVGLPGYLCTSLLCLHVTLINDAHSTVWWAKAHIKVDSQTHSDIWNGCFRDSGHQHCVSKTGKNLGVEGKKLVRFAECAVYGLPTDCAKYSG